MPNTPEAGHLSGSVQRIETITAAQRDRMYFLLTCYFTNVSRSAFEADLAEKEWVILLTDTTTGEIRGFSTLMSLHAHINGEPITAFFSGDTIIQREYWGETVLPRLWAQHVFGAAETIKTGKVYWYLICSGYKTYRFLSTFFSEFYPTYRHPTPPAVKTLLDSLGRLKFPHEYNSATGVVRLANSTPLRSGVAEITPRHLTDPHIAFFAAANPGHLQGDELACLTEISPANLTAAGKRMLSPR